MTSIRAVLAPTLGVGAALAMPLSHPTLRLPLFSLRGLGPCLAAQTCLEEDEGLDWAWVYPTSVLEPTEGVQRCLQRTS